MDRNGCESCHEGGWKCLERALHLISLTISHQRANGALSVASEPNMAKRMGARGVSILATMITSSTRSWSCAPINECSAEARLPHASAKQKARLR